MNTITVTADQLKDSFLTELPDDQRQTLYNTWQERIDINDAAEMLAAISESTMKRAKENPEDAAAYKEWSRMDKILWAIKESYIFGILQAFEIMAAANRMSIDELFGEEARP